MKDRKVRALKDKAANLVEKRKFKKALQIYDTLLEERPGDTALMLKIGEVNRLSGNYPAAIDAYSHAAHYFAEGGFLLKGIAVCKVILDIDPEHSLTQMHLAELYTSQYGALPRKRPDGAESGHIPTVSEPAGPPLEERMSQLEMEVDLSDMERASLASADVSAATQPSAAPRMAVCDDRLSADELPKIPLFSALDRESFIALLTRIPLHHVGADEYVVHEGEMGTSFYIVVEGRVRVVKAPDIPLAELGPGAFFGEMAIIAPRSRRASVITTEPSQILEVSQAVLDELTGQYPNVFSVLSQFTEERLLRNLLVTSPLFAPFPPDDRERLMENFQSTKFVRGQDIITQDQDAPGLFLIASGSVDIDCNGDVIASLSEGDIFGEISLLLRSKATATVRAAENTRTLLLPRDLFNELIMTHPQILEMVAELKEQRMNPPAPEEHLSRELASELDGGSAIL